MSFMFDVSTSTKQILMMGEFNIVEGDNSSPSLVTSLNYFLAPKQ